MLQAASIIIIIIIITIIIIIIIKKHHPIQCVPGALSLGVNRPGRETDHSPPSRAEVK
jgi:hypothetical protein